MDALNDNIGAACGLWGAGHARGCSSAGLVCACVQRTPAICLQGLRMHVWLTCTLPSLFSQAGFPGTWVKPSGLQIGGVGVGVG